MTNKKLDKSQHVILSASRMTDMPKYYPDQIIEGVKQPINRGLQIHSLVLWTKHPDSLFKEPLYSFLQHLKENGIQLSIQLTITGLGGLVVGKDDNGLVVFLEPNVPLLRESMDCLTSVISLVNNPERIIFRIDPIIHILVSNKEFTNRDIVIDIINEAAQLGIKNFKYSFLEKGIHKKVDRQFANRGVEIIQLSKEDKTDVNNGFCELNKKYNVTISSCCVDGLTGGACISGYDLDRLHPTNCISDKSEPRKRELCGCTKTIDLGGWPPKVCGSGCLYCYSKPKLIE